MIARDLPELITGAGQLMIGIISIRNTKSWIRRKYFIWLKLFLKFLR